jgi:DNA polymerase alpha subunit A
MYGCLGFSNSRFYAQPIAALVTAMGREILQRTVDITQNSIGLDVIYGDTDSIMINTRISDPKELDKVMELGNKVKKEVNRLYKTLELEIDGIFRSMLLLKKKKYAAVTVEMTPAGPKYGNERKGLDLVRRDWCIQSKDTGEYVLDQILSGGETEVVVHNIHEHLEELAKTMRAGELPIEKYVITKGLSKHPNDYPDGKSQPHVQVAKLMLQNNRPVNMGDHIPYIITAPPADSEAASKSPADRARHPDDIARSGGLLKPDVEWYLTQQILPPVTRLCEPIEGTSPSILAQKLGLDSSKYKNNNGQSIGEDAGDEENQNLVDFTPSSRLPDDERFKDVMKLQFACVACKVTSEFPGVFCNRGITKEGLSTGLTCVNPSCPRPKYWGHDQKLGASDCLARLSNAVAVLVHNQMKVYYASEVLCDDPTCCSKTRQLSVAGACCLGRGCCGQMRSIYSDRALHTQLVYLETLFNVEHAAEKWELKEIYGAKKDLKTSIHKNDTIVFDELKACCTYYLSSNAFNFVDPSFWQQLFGNGLATSER